MDAEELADMATDVAANQGGTVCFDSEKVSWLIRERTILIEELKRLTERLEHFAWTYRPGSSLHELYAKEALIARGVLGSVYMDRRVMGGVYGKMCRYPDLCSGKGYCPRDPACCD